MTTSSCWTFSYNYVSEAFYVFYLNLTDGTYKPFRKPGDTPVYVHMQSNHPPAVKKNIPQNVENRLNMLSCNETVFNQAKPLYQDALRASRYTHELEYKKVCIRTASALSEHIWNLKDEDQR